MTKIMYDEVVENLVEEYFRNIPQAQDETLIFDTLFLGRQGGIGRDSQSIFSVLSKRNLSLLKYRNRTSFKSPDEFRGPTTQYLHLSSIMNIHTPNLPIPEGMSIWFSQFTSWNIRDRNTQDFIRVHDLFPLTNPEWFPFKQRALFKRNISHINETTRFVANSSYTADCLMGELGIPHTQIDLLPCRVEQLSTKKCGDCEGCQFEGLDKFALSVGTIEPRKNYEFLIRNWLSGDSPMQLVIVGRNGWKSGNIVKLLNSDEPKIVWLRNACDGSLQSLYKNCEYFISSSLDEGFDLPTNEANMYGCKLILSDIPVHREIDPGNVMLFTKDSDREFRSLI